MMRVEHSDWRVWGALIAAAGLTRAALGMNQYPFGDDFVYGPLARLAADPSAYPGDVQLRMFDNHAWLYAWIWRAAEASIGVVGVHLILTLLLTFAAAFGMLAIARATGAKGVWAPLAFAIVSLLEARGIGRGAYGGVFGDHFHLQHVAIVCSIWAVAAAMNARSILSGTLLGAAAIAQPVLALHAAAAVGGAALFAHGWRSMGVIALTSAVVAAPSILTSLGAGSLDAPVDVGELIEKGYLWRVWDHYVIPSNAFLIHILFLAAGGYAAIRLRAGAGAMAAFAGMTLLIAIFHLESGLEAFRTLSIWPYIVDLTRSSPLFWAIAASLAAALAERREASDGLVLAIFVGAALIMSPPLDPVDWAVLAITAALPFIRRWIAPLGLATGALAAGWSLWASEDTRTRIPQFVGFYEWAATTEPDAVLIAPPMVAEIREYAKRSVWVDFRAVSMSQPDQIMESRRRHEAITPGYDELEPVGGWKGAWLWTVAYSARNGPEEVRALLEDTEATYFVTFTESAAAEGGAGLAKAYADDHVTVLTLE